MRNNQGAPDKEKMLNVRLLPDYRIFFFGSEW